MPDQPAIVCIAYGTDPLGLCPSPMTVDVVKEARNQEGRYPTAIFILQGGDSLGHAYPKESEIMADMLSDRRPLHDLLCDTVSRNTVQGAKEVIRLARRSDVTELVIVAETFHLWRVSYTFAKLLKDSGIAFRTVGVSTPFGGNSQKRLNSALWWWFWEFLARIYTIAFVH